MQPFSRLRINLRQHIVQPPPTAGLRRNVHQRAPRRLVAALGKRHRARDGVDIQPRAAAEHRAPAAPQYLRNAAVCHFPIPGGGEFLRRIDHAEHVVRYAAHFVGGRAGRKNIHAPVDLHGIGGYYLAARFQAERDCARGFSGRGWPCNDRKSRFHHKLLYPFEHFFQLTL